MIHCRVCSFWFPEVIGYSSSFFKFALRHSTFYGWSRNTDGVIELHNRLLWRDQEFIQLSILCHTSYYSYFQFPNCSFTSETSMRPLFLTAKGNLRRWHCVENQHTLDMNPNRNIHEASVAPCANCIILTASSLLSQMTNKDGNTFSPLES